MLESDAADRRTVAADFEGITPAEGVAGCEGITPYLQGKVSITNPCQCCYCQVCTAGLLALCLHTASQDCILSQSHTVSIQFHKQNVFLVIMYHNPNIYVLSSVDDWLKVQQPGQIIQSNVGIITLLMYV